MQKEIKAKYNDISVTQKQCVKDEPYKYIVIRGNNSELVKKCLDSRQGSWTEISSINTLYNFKWVPFLKGIRFDYLSTHGIKKMVNHFEFQEQISQKDNLYFNLQKYCESQKLNIFNFHPVTFVIDFDQNSQFTELDKFYAFFNTLERNKSQLTSIAQINQQIQLIPQFSSSKHNCSTKYDLQSTMFNGSNFWLIKPPDFNRGRGVQVFNNLDQFKKLVHGLQQGLEINLGQSEQVPQSNQEVKQIQNFNSNQSSIQNSKLNQHPSNVPPEQVLKNFTNLENVPNIVKTNQIVIQKYLERPLLIQNRKFDIRLWVLIDHEMKCYLFKEGYIRTSSEVFDLSPDTINKPFIHLTNNAVQRFNQQYGVHEEGNQLSFSKVNQILKEEGTFCDIYEIVRGPITDIILLTLKSVENKLNKNDRKFSIEIFGYDFIIDDNQKPWLIEVNTNPCLEESSRLLKSLIPRMIDDALKLTLDVVFPLKKPQAPQVSTFHDNSLIKEEKSKIQDDSLVTFQIIQEPGIGQEAGSRSIFSQVQKNAIFVQSLNSSIDEMDIREERAKTDKLIEGQESQKQLKLDKTEFTKSKYSVDGYSDAQNLWQHIYSMKTS